MGFRRSLESVRTPLFFEGLPKAHYTVCQNRHSAYIVDAAFIPEAKHRGFTPPPYKHPPNFQSACNDKKSGLFARLPSTDKRRKKPLSQIYLAGRAPNKSINQSLHFYLITFFYTCQALFFDIFI